MNSIEHIEQPNQSESIGRIEVAPEVIITITQIVVQNSAGVTKLGTPPSDVGHLFRRTKQNGVTIRFVDDKLVFDIYVLMDPDVSIIDSSRQLQVAIVEAIDKMVGIPVAAVNIHVEDVAYQQKKDS